MMNNNCQAGYITPLSPTFLLKTLPLTQAFQCKKNHSIPNWYEESKNSKTGVKNWNKLYARTSECKKTYLENDFETPTIEFYFATIQMRLVANFNLSTCGAKMDFVWGTYACFTKQCTKQIADGIQLRDWVEIDLNFVFFLFSLFFVFFSLPLSKTN